MDFVNKQFIVSEIDRRIVAIVSFGPACPTDGSRPATFYQVTIDPKRLSPSGDFIRFGGYDGDEIIGWQRSSMITIVEILGDWPEGEGMPLLYYGKQEKAKFMLLEPLEDKSLTICN